ncbi:hypothetical protein [Kitasatospora griseola]|uniref:hypothetical protein n=1 Tax=Kitasatospora griseola TaxID=2064 RepID=UPI003816AA7D
MIATLIRYLARFTAGPAPAATRRFGQPARRPRPAPEPQPPSSAGVPIPADATAASGDQMEGVFAAALLAGLIGPVEYRRSMAVLAHADDADRPLHVPRW